MKIKELKFIETEKGVVVAKLDFILAEIHHSKVRNDYYISTTFPFYIDRRFETLNEAKEYLQIKFNEFITKCIEI